MSTLAAWLVLLSTALATGHTGLVDLDGDGVAIPVDCDDNDDETYPGAAEVLADGIDQDCDGVDTCFTDLDGDGYGTDEPVVDNDLDCANTSAPTAALGGDCHDDPDDRGAQANPEQTEVCDGIDNDCNGVLDDATSPDARTLYRDADGDGYGVTTDTIRACGIPVGYVERSGDCDDDEARSFPGRTEICDAVDNDCDGVVDGPLAIDVRVWVSDADGDGYRDPPNRSSQVESCPRPDGDWLLAGGPVDCHPTDPARQTCGCGCAMPTAPAPSPWLALSVLLAAGTRRRP